MRNLTRTLFLSALLLVSAACASGGSGPGSTETPVAPAIVPADVRYGAGFDGEPLVGHLALPAGESSTPRPAVLVVHEWWGRTEHADRSVDELARLGYVALSVDMYGGGRTTDDGEVAGKWSAAVKNLPDKGASRVQAAIDFLSAQPGVDRSRVAVIGYCFGGRVALDAAWAGLDLRAVVSFHGSLTTPTAAQAPDVKASILVLHGADDPFVPQASIDAFVASMKEHDYDWAMTWFGNAVHSFTNPASDGSMNPGAKYEARAAVRSWDEMKAFLARRMK